MPNPVLRASFVQGPSFLNVDDGAPTKTADRSSSKHRNLLLHISIYVRLLRMHARHTALGSGDSAEARAAGARSIVGAGTGAGWTVGDGLANLPSASCGDGA